MLRGGLQFLPLRSSGPFRAGGWEKPAGHVGAYSALARVSHEFSAAAPDPTARAALRLVGLLDVSVKYASVALPARALP